MKVAIISDLHFGVKNNSPFFLSVQEEFFYKQFIPYLQHNNIDTVWVLGDIFENRKVLNVHIMNRMFNFFKELSVKGIKTVCIAGNHDHYFKNTNDVSSLSPLFEQINGLTLVKDRAVIEFDGIPVGFISWIPPEDKDACLEWIKTVNVDILCGHFEINSFEIVKGVICESGFDTSLFERFDVVLSGHFHIRSTNGIIQYVGNPYQTNWGEYGYRKGFHIFDPETKELTFIPNNKDIFFVINYDDSFDITNFDASQYSDKIVRIIVSPESTNKNKLTILSDRLSVFCHTVEILEDRLITLEEDEYDIKADTFELIRQFISNCHVVDLDKKELELLIYDIYNESLERSKNDNT